MDDLIPNSPRWGDTLADVENYTIEVLGNLSALDYERSKSAIEIYQKFKELHPEVDIPESTFRQCLSKLINTEESRITKQEGRQGYFLSTFVNSIEPDRIDEEQHIVEYTDDPTTNPLPETPKIAKREFLLYPILEQWLNEQNYKVGKSIFNKRGNETWGNPDVAGIRVEEHLGRLEIEIVTIEVKASKDQWGNRWRRDIFEAVSHKRYANRVYFCFTVKFGDKISDLADMKYYCELYGIGLILIELNPDLYDIFDKGTNLSHFTDENKELIQITEKFSAPYGNVSLKYQREFCENTLEVKNLSDLFKYGIR